MAQSCRSSWQKPSVFLIMREMVFRGRAVILEIKVARAFGEMEKLCDEALQQIEQQNYAANLLEDGCSSVLQYGVCFYKKGCMIKKR